MIWIISFHSLTPLFHRFIRSKSRKKPSFSMFLIKMADLQYTNWLKWNITWKFKVSWRKECFLKLKALQLVQSSREKSMLRSVRSMQIRSIRRRKSMIKHLSNTSIPSDTWTQVMSFRDILRSSSFQIWSSTWKSLLKPQLIRHRVFKM